jgi:hypothetical protein
VKTTKLNPTGYAYSIAKQLCNLIPSHLVPKLAREHGVDVKARTFTPWSHVVSLIFAHVTRSTGLNEVCDSLHMNAGMLSTIRGAVPPVRNTFSHANRERPASMAQALYWAVMDALVQQSPAFCKSSKLRGFLRRFRTAIHAIDSTTIQLIASCMSWAKHRRRKAAAKCHLRLHLQSQLPQCVIVDSAKDHDAKKALALCDGLKEGEIVIGDRAYVDFPHLWTLDERGVYWVMRTKRQLRLRVVRRRKTASHERIVRDDEVVLVKSATRQSYPSRFRRIRAWVEVDGREVLMEFMTNNLEWSPWTVAELYRARWDIEVFFKELKQTLQFTDFFGHNASAVQWQIWTGLLTHLLLRYEAFLSTWNHSFSRLAAIIRAAWWKCWHLNELLQSYGTAGGRYRFLGPPIQGLLPGFEMFTHQPVGQPM